MITQTRLESKPGYLIKRITGDVAKATLSITIPNQALDIKYAMKAYKSGTLIEKQQAIYEKEGIEMPNFSMMDRIQKLEEFARIRKLKKDSLFKLEKIKSDATAKQKAAQGAKAPNEKHDSGESK